MENNEFIFIHVTYTPERIKKIFKDGKIKSGDQLKKEERMYSGGQPQKHIFTHLITKNNINYVDKDFADFGIVIKPDILKHKTMYFNQFWGGSPNIDAIVTSPTDTVDVRLKKLNKINMLIKNPKQRKPIWFMDNEALFNKNIDIKYIFAIVIAKKYTDEFKKIIPKDVKIYHNYIDAFNNINK